MLDVLQKLHTTHQDAHFWIASNLFMSFLVWGTKRLPHNLIKLVSQSNDKHQFNYLLKLAFLNMVSICLLKDSVEVK